MGLFKKINGGLETLIPIGTQNFTLQVNAPNINGSPIETNTSLQSKGGLLKCIDEATGDTARTTNGWIEDEKYGFYAINFASGTSFEFDSAIKRTGEFTLKLSTTNTTGVARVYTQESIYGTYISNKNILVKPNTKYKINCFVKTNNIPTNGGWISIQQYNNGVYVAANDTNKISGTNDWTLLYANITTTATTNGISIAFFNGVAGNISDAWFDINSMTLEEVVETTNNTLTAKSPAITSFVANGTYDNIDQSLDINGAYTNTYTLGTSIVESATTIQEFTPTKAKQTRIPVWITDKGTGDWTLTVHSSSNAIQSSSTIANANLTSGAINYFTVPYNWTSGTYHFHLISTVADGTVKCNTTNDLNTCSFATNYYKPCTNLKASLNGDIIDLSADSDGFLDGSIIDLENGIFSFKEDFTNSLYLKNYTISGSDLICKVNLPSEILSGTFTSDKTLTYSTDNSTYTNTIPTGVTLFYIKLASYSGITSFSFSINLDTSTIKKLYNYPTNKAILNTYVKTLTTATTTATYRATKYGFPALEYAEGVFQYLKVDTSDSLSTVQLSADGVTYETKTDGESLTISSTTIPIIYTNLTITKNRLLLSSNDYNADGTKDGSNVMTVVYKDRQQGMSYDIAELQEEINLLKTKLASL